MVHAQTQPIPDNERRFYATLARFMPWTISGLVHVAAFLIMLVVMLLSNQTPKTRADLHIPGVCDTLQSTAFHSASTPSVQPSTSQPRTATKTNPSNSPETGESQKPLCLIASEGGALASGKSGRPVGQGPGDTTVFQTPPEFGNTDDILYVIDRSGSMLDTLDAIAYNMTLSISALSPQPRVGMTFAQRQQQRKRRFGILFFSDTKPIAFQSARLVKPTMENQLAAATFLQGVFPLGKTDPVPALQRAFASLRDAQKSANAPRNQLIYLLTDGVFPDSNAVIRLVRAELRDNPRVQICTILYGHRPPAAETTLKTIATLSGGTYRYVSLNK
ncbi:MAG: VWA domain-containing protein [Phycisphaerales bacterium]|jgi:hypothetical protein|nr:VWA domain-containing protein [Phycisphaerales bacterium]